MLKGDYNLILRWDHLGFEGRSECSDWCFYERKGRRGGLETQRLRGEGHVKTEQSLELGCRM